jgi:uncharacterized repeat protein (TIGR01451 family)
MRMKRTFTTAMTDRGKPLFNRVSSIICFGVVLSFLAASVFYAASSAASRKQISGAAQPANPVKRDNRTPLKGANSRFLNTSRFSSAWVPAFLAPDDIATYEAASGACTNNPKVTFVLGEEVCVKASAPVDASRLSVSGTDGTVATVVDVTSDPQEFVYTLPNTTTSVVNDNVVDNRGIWRATVHSSADFGARAVAFFSVSDPGNAAADLIVFADNTDADTITPGDATGFIVSLKNDGPDSATAAHVTQTVPANMTFTSATAGDGTSFTCTESSGVVDCVPAGALPAGASSTFTINYTVDGGAPNAIATTEVDISSTTTDPYPSSNASTADYEIRAAGSSPPTCSVSCPLNMTVSANTTQGSQTGAIVSFESEPSGDCGSITSSPASGSFFPTGTTTVNISSANGGGGCSFTITVTETAAPTITCAADQTATTSGSSNEAAVTVNAPTATGTNVQVDGVRSDNRELSDDYPVGTTTITWTARECNNPPACDDPNARFATCKQKIIVTSPDAPTITCPSDKTFSSGCNGATLTSAQIGTPTATGSGVTVEGQRSDNLDLYADAYPVGTTVITWSATDDGGRVVSCSQSITVNTTGSDTTPPTLTAPPNVTVSTTGCSQIVGETELGTSTATDDCGTPNVKRTGVPLGNLFPTGTTTITYTATDGAGNTATATQTVTVTESVNPTISAPADLVLTTGSGATSCGVVVGDATLGTAPASDNCPGVTVSRTGVPAGNFFPVGETTITYTATDRSGNTASATQKVTVSDNTPPVITLNGANPQIVECHTSYPELGASATDNCGSVTATPSGSVDVNTPGTYTITYNSTDSAGNQATPVQRTVIVQDTIAPTINLTGFAPSMWPPNHKYTTFQLTQFVASATDGCDTTIDINDVVIEKVTSDEIENGNGDGNTLNDIVIAANCKSVQLRAEREGNGNGRIYTMTFKVRDASGNIGRATATVRVAHNPGETVVDSGVHYTVNGSCP